MAEKKDLNMTTGFPTLRCRLEYVCLGCGARYPIDELQYACPRCGGVFLLENLDFDRLKETSPEAWRALFDSRLSTRISALRGVFRFYELIAPVVDEEDILYLGEAGTPIVEASDALAALVGRRFAFKNDGQNPSASFKDRGMACAFSFLRHLCRRKGWQEVLTICASTGDTSAAAALYAAYAGGPIKSAVLLPRGKVTPAQLSQPLGSGATVLEIPGVFDDCMKVVEYLSEHYRVALLNSKNAWRILGQESFACEVAQWYDWRMKGRCVFVPIGNAGNITAIMSGFLKLHALGIIEELPRIFGVQSEHADPVFRYYDAPAGERRFEPVSVRPSVAQAAMIGNPVSFPRVRVLAEQYRAIGGADAFTVLRVSEQAIMEAMLLANRHGHIACTQGGECLAGLMAAIKADLVDADEHAVLDSTAHSLKFATFQERYFEGSLGPGYGISTRPDHVNAPRLAVSGGESASPGEAAFTAHTAKAIASLLGLREKED